jgi:two-component system response regulator RegX3
VTRILLVEDEQGLGEALEYQLERNGYEVDRVGDGLVGLKRFKSAGADVVLLDLMLPGMPGEEVCKEIRKDSTVPIIMLTAKDTELERVLGLELGADDYVTKPFSTPELLARVKAVLRRSRSKPAASSEVLEGAGIRLDPEGLEVSFEGRPIHLARKEFDLLECLMSAPGRIISRETLIDDVWGADYFGDSRTLDVHIKRLREKFEPDPHNPVHFVTARGFGYKFVP